MSERREFGTFDGPDAMVTLLRARQVELALSNEALEEICGFARGQVNKYLGPSREKAPGAFVLCTLMDSLGLSGVLYVDPTKVARLSKAWAREGRRRGSNVRGEPSRVSKVIVKRARPEVLRERSRQAALARWKATTREERVQISEYMHHCRWGKWRKMRASTQK